MKNNYLLRAKWLLSTCVFSLMAWSASAQAPGNDDCAGAVVLTVNPTFDCAVSTQATTIDATESFPADCDGDADDDVWFQFTATGPNHTVNLLNITSPGNGSTDMYFQIFEGTCDGTSSVFCSDSDTDLVQGLTTGQVYYVRVYSYYNFDRQNFSICIGSPPPPPANDECTGAIALTVNPDFSCSSSVAGTTTGATQSMASDPCDGYPDDDVWYSFVATSDMHRIVLNEIEPVVGWSTDMYFQVLEGDCSGLGSVICSDPEEGTVENLTPGTTYYIRVYSYSTAAYQTFNICVGTPPPAPANDDCAGAVMLTVNPDFDCAATTAATTVSATESMEENCNGNPDDDVWFSFIATGETHSVKLMDIEAVLGWSEDMYFEVFDGDCDANTSLFCSDNDMDLVTGLTAGQTYYLRVYSYFDDSRQNFNICIGTPPPAPANDNCDGAIVLTVNADLDCAVKTSSQTTGATQSMDPDPCFGEPDDDVWFSFIATQDAHRISLTNIEPVIGWSTDMYFQVLEGGCGALSSVECSDDEAAIVANLVPGNLYYVRVYTYGTGYASFDICVGTLPPPPTNDDCDSAIVLTVNPDIDCVAATSGATVGATQSMDADPCFGSPDDDVWFSFTATSESHMISLFDTESIIGWGGDMYFQVLTGTCDALSSEICSDDDTAIVENLIPGEIYYIRVYTYDSGAYSTFKICVGTIPPPPANDNCAGAVSITAGAEFSTNDIVVSNAGAGDSDADDPDCANYQGGDVWYSVVIPDSGSLTIETHYNDNSQLFDTGMAVYSGDCDTLSMIECDDDDSDDGNFSLIELTNRTPGEIIYIRLWEYGGDLLGTFRLSAYDASLSAESFTQDSFRHYPNPVKDVLNLSYTSEITSVEVYNLLGQKMLSKTFNATETAIDMSALADGAYIVNVTAGDTVKTIKVIKKQ